MSIVCPPSTLRGFHSPDAFGSRCSVLRRPRPRRLCFAAPPARVVWLASLSALEPSTIRLSFARACVRRSPRVCGLSSPQPTRALVGADGRCGPPRGCSSCLPFPLASGSTVAARAQCVSPTVGLDPSSRVPWLLVLASFAHARGVDRLSSPQGGRWGGGGDAWNAPVVHARPPPPNASSQQAPPNAAGQGDGGEQRVAD